MSGFPPEKRLPWEGPGKCGEPTRGGLPCQQWEIDGLGTCFAHVPEEMLEEAEEITGLRRCRWSKGCRYVATEGGDLCTIHAREGSPQSQHAGARAIEAQAIQRMQEIMSMNGERLLNPPKIGDPFIELLSVASEIKEWKEILRLYVSQRRLDQLSYRGKVAEQVRGEVILYERAIERLHNVLVNIVKLKIEDRLAGVEERTMDLIERGLEMAIKAGCSAIRQGATQLEGEQEAKEVLRRELPLLAV